MASTTSFKQQCPSCEAMVPIRDPGPDRSQDRLPQVQVPLRGGKAEGQAQGRRRVLQRHPGADQEGQEARRARKPASNARPGKNGKLDAVAAGKSKTKPAARRRDEDDEDEERSPEEEEKRRLHDGLLGAGLGGLALLLLIVGGVMLFGGGSAAASTKPSTPPPGGSGPPMTQNPGPAVKPGAGDNKPPTAQFIADVTNLLPNDAETVVNYQIDKLHDSGLGQAALGTPARSARTAFADTFSFPFYADGDKGVERVVTAISNTNHWVFTVLHTQKNAAIDKDKLIASLQLEAHPPVNGMIAYSVKRDLDALGDLLIKANRAHDDLQVVILDSQTLVFADPAPMKKFLDDKGHPTLKSQPTAATPPAKPGPGPGGLMPPGPAGSMPPARRIGAPRTWRFGRAALRQPDRAASGRRSGRLDASRPRRLDAPSRPRRLDDAAGYGPASGQHAARRPHAAGRLLSDHRSRHEGRLRPDRKIR